MDRRDKVLERDMGRNGKGNGADSYVLEHSSLRVRQKQHSMEAWESYYAVEKHSR